MFARLLLSAIATVSFASLASAIEPTLVLDLWPGKAPDENKTFPAEGYTPTKPGSLDVKRLGNVTKPQLAIYKAKENPTGAMVVIAPGGGYSILAIEHEGEEVAAWLNSINVSAAVLKYRVPKRDRKSPESLENLVQLQDAQRAMGIVRSKASEWGVNPERVGVLGFSAGGNLMATLCTHYEKRDYAKVDAADELSARPNFAVLVYPAYLTDKEGKLRAEYPVNKQTPPMFFAHASDDPVTSEGSVALYRALKANGVSGELHLYVKGGHGFGLRPNKGPVSEWPQRCSDWLRLNGWAK